MDHWTESSLAREMACPLFVKWILGKNIVNFLNKIEKDIQEHLKCRLQNVSHFQCVKCYASSLGLGFIGPREPTSATGNPTPLQWRHNGRDGVSNHQPHDCLLNRLFRCRSKKTSKHRVTGLCEGNSPVTGEIPAQRASNAENVSIWWRHHVLLLAAIRAALAYYYCILKEMDRVITLFNRIIDFSNPVQCYPIWSPVVQLTREIIMFTFHKQPPQGWF